MASVTSLSGALAVTNTKAGQIALRFDLTNNGTLPINICKRGTPFGSLQDGNFLSFYDSVEGKDIDYCGPSRMRNRVPTGKDFITIAPGATVSTAVHCESPNFYTYPCHTYTVTVACTFLKGPDNLDVNASAVYDTEALDVFPITSVTFTAVE